MEPWGVETAVDLSRCDRRLVSSASAVKRFAVGLCRLLKVKRFGPPTVVRFGSDPRVRGLSMVQLIEDSLVSGHFVDASRAAFINVFSCKPYNAEAAARFCVEFFGAELAKLTINCRNA